MEDNRDFFRKILNRHNGKTVYGLKKKYSLFYICVVF